MTRSYVAILVVLGVSVAVLVWLRYQFPVMPIAPLGMALAVAGVFTLAVKFALSDLLSSSGFDEEKTAVDLALTLVSTLFAMAMGQHEAAGRVVFPAIVKLVDGAAAVPTAPRAGELMWWSFGAAAALFASSLFLLVQLNRMRARTVPTKGPWRDALRVAAVGLMRLSILGCFAVSYALYMITVLFKA